MDKVTRQCPQTTAFLKRKESRSGIELRSFRLPTLPLGQTGSQNVNWKAEALNWLTGPLADCCLWYLAITAEKGWGCGWSMVPQCHRTYFCCSWSSCTSIITGRCPSRAMSNHIKYTGVVSSYVLTHEMWLYSESLLLCKGGMDPSNTCP